MWPLFSYVITAGTKNFTLGAPVVPCTANSDGTTDCLVPITATPSILGQFTGSLSVTGTKGVIATFPLSGYFVQSPLTRTSVSFASGVTCTGTTIYSTKTSIALTAAVVANGPNPPTGNIVFTATAGTTVTTIGTAPIANMGSTSSPAYGATLTYTFATPATYTLSATYSGDTSSPVYFKGSTGASPTTLTTALPSYSMATTGTSKIL